MALPFWLKSSPFWMICVEICSAFLLPSWPQWKRLVLWHLNRQPWIRSRWRMLLHPQGKIFSCLTLPDCWLGIVQSGSVKHEKIFPCGWSSNHQRGRIQGCRFRCQRTSRFHCGHDGKSFAQGPLRPLMEVARYAPSTMAVGATPTPISNKTRGKRPPTIMDCIQAIHYPNPQSRCFQGPQPNQGHPGGVAISSGTTGRRMVDQQGGHLWHGKCPTLLGPDGCHIAQTLLLDLPTHRLGLCLRWWFLLASSDFDSNSGHCATVALPGSLRLPLELAQDGTLRGQHLVGFPGQPTWRGGWFSFGQEEYPGDTAQKDHWWPILNTGSSLLIFWGLIVPAVSSLFVRAVNSKPTCWWPWTWISRHMTRWERCVSSFWSINHSSFSKFFFAISRHVCFPWARESCCRAAALPLRICCCARLGRRFWKTNMKLWLNAGRQKKH